MQANGGPGVYGAGPNSGAGSGGGVLIRAGSISGAGTVQANGGAGMFANFNNAGSGGGGRIAVYYDAMSLPSANLVARGGTGNSSSNGGAGTVYLKDNAQADGDLVVDNGGPVPGLYTRLMTERTTLRNLTVRNAGWFGPLGTDVPSFTVLQPVQLVSSAVMQLGGGVTLTVTNTSGSDVQVLSGSTLTLAPGSALAADRVRVNGAASTLNTSIPLAFPGATDLELSGSPTATINVLNNVTLSLGVFDPTNVMSGTVNLTSGSRLDVAANAVTVGNTVTLVKDGSFGAADQIGTLTVLSGGVVTHSQRLLAGLVLNVGGTLDVQAGGRIDVSTKGLLGGGNGSAFGNRGEAFDPVTDAIVAGAGFSGRGAGGGYGGLGGSSLTGALSNPVYGMLEDPRHLGGGGGAGVSAGAFSGHGGGRMTVVAGSAIVNGQLLANGGNAAVGTGGGAGSGGAIRLDVTTLSGSGQVQARGGTGANTGDGAGGGGRIAIYACQQLLPVPNISVTGGTGGNVGQPGTVHLAALERTITASAGAHGNIAPAGAVVVGCGANQSFSISPEPGFQVADVLVDGVSVGAVSTYLFSNVSEAHTIVASFAAVAATNTIIPVSPGVCITPSQPCVQVPVQIARSTSEPLRGFSIDVLLSTGLTFCAPVDEGSYLSTIGSTQFQIVDNGGGSYTIDCAILGLPCGATAAAGSLFTLNLGSALPGGIGTVTLTSVSLRDCANAVVSGAPGAPASINIDNVVPTAIAALAATQQTAGNDADGTTKIIVSWPAVEAGASVLLYRKGFGFYPEYDDAGGAPPATPTYPPAGWTLAGTVSGPVSFTDETTARDFYYYVAFVKDGCGNVSAVSNRTNGTLNYHLGDVQPVALLRGNNLVNTADVSNLGINYGVTLAFNDPLNDLDVGPTTDFSVNARPTTDNRVQFEDLIVFAVNYDQVSAPAMVAKPAGKEGSEQLELQVPELPTLGETFAVALALTSPGTVKGVSVQLAFDAAVVEPLGVEAGELLTGQHVPSVVLSAKPGNVDAALLGTGEAISGRGELARALFRVIAKGDAAIRVGTLLARDKDNRAISLGSVATPAGSTLPARTALGMAFPNPFQSETTIELVLRHESNASLDVYDLSGRRVASVMHGMQPAGMRLVKWDGRGERGVRLAPGIYLMRLEADGLRQTRRVLLVP